MFGLVRKTPVYSRRWAGPAIVVGGLCMAGIWMIFTQAHGATTENEERVVLGHDMHLWGLLLGTVPNFFIAAGLIALRPWLSAGGQRLAEVGQWVVCVALLLSAAADLAVRGLNAPIFMPFVGGGLVALAAGNRRDSRLSKASRSWFWALGILLLIAFAWALGVPEEVSDPIGGYRIFGAGGYFAVGLAWAALGTTLSKDHRSVSQPTGTA